VDVGSGDGAWDGKLVGNGIGMADGSGIDGILVTVGAGVGKMY